MQRFLAMKVLTSKVKPNSALTIMWHFLWAAIQPWSPEPLPNVAVIWKVKFKNYSPKNRHKVRSRGRKEWDENLFRSITRAAELGVDYFLFHLLSHSCMSMMKALTCAFGMDFFSCELQSKHSRHYIILAMQGAGFQLMILLCWMNCSKCFNSELSPKFCNRKLSQVSQRNWDKQTESLLTLKYRQLSLKSASQGLSNEMPVPISSTWCFPLTWTRAEPAFHTHLWMA